MPSGLAFSGIGMKLTWNRLISGVVGFPGTGTCRVQKNEANAWTVSTNF